MRLGILSDTHGYFHPGLPDFLSDVDAILHAGDVGTVEVLDALARLAPVHAVYGNVDGQPIRRRVPDVQTLTFDGVRFLMTHIGGHPERWSRGVRALIDRHRPDVFVCGHSHILRIERVSPLGGMLYLNPGAAGRQGFHQAKTLVLLETHDGKATKADVVHLDSE